MAVIERLDTLLELGGLIHRVTISAEPQLPYDDDIGFLEIHPSHTALLDYEDVVALRDWAQDIINMRENPLPSGAI